MSEYKFPSQPYDRGKNMLALLGSHWASTYRGSYTIESYLLGRSLEQAQSHQNLLEAIAALSRYDVPIYHTDHWHFLPLRQSQQSARTLRFGDGAVFGPQPDTGEVYRFGDPLNSHRVYFPAPEKLAKVQLIFNRLTDPSASLVYGVDFVIEDDFLVFSSDPFADERFPQLPLYEGSDIVDYEIVMWLFAGQFDWQYVYDHFAYMLGLQLETSEGYKAYMNAIFDAFAAGSSARSLDMALAALTGVPVVQETVEVVETILTNGDTLSIITDRNAYQFPTTATATVSPGETVYAGQHLTDLVQLHDLTSGVMPDGVQTLIATREWLGAGYLDGLAFHNEDVSLVVEENVAPDGLTKISFPLGGHDEDQERFWAEVHSRGVEAGQTLARLLDVRGPDADTEPTAASLPTTINPLQFLTANLLRYNVSLAHIKHSLLPASALDLAAGRLLRRIVPPWTSFIILAEMLANTDSVTPDQAGSETEAGTESTPETQLGGEVTGEEVDPDTAVDEWPTLTYEEGVCDT